MGVQLKRPGRFSLVHEVTSSLHTMPNPSPDVDKARSMLQQLDDSSNRLLSLVESQNHTPKAPQAIKVDLDQAHHDCNKVSPVGCDCNVVISSWLRTMQMAKIDAVGSTAAAMTCGAIATWIAGKYSFRFARIQWPIRAFWTLIPGYLVYTTIYDRSVKDCLERHYVTRHNKPLVPTPVIAVLEVAKEQR